MDEAEDEGRNRRQSERRALQLCVDYLDRTGQRAGRTADVSRGGFSFRTNVRHAIGDVVGAMLSYPGVVTPVSVHGKVMYVRTSNVPDDPNPYTVGVQVEDVEAGNRLGSIVDVASDRLSGPRATFAALPRVSLATLPTPLQRASRLSEVLGGPEIWFKRDDLTGFALGGNKIRKLEYFVADALEKGAEALVTGAKGPQSNHVRITMAAASHLNLKGYAVIPGDTPEKSTGNLLLNDLLAAEILRPERPDLGIDESIEVAVQSLQAQGIRAYGIPLGGASWLGTMGYVSSGLELSAQLEAYGIEANHLICATGSCGTHAGLELATRWVGTPYIVHGMSISRPADDCRARISRLVAETAEHLGLDIAPPPEAIDVNDSHIGEGYGVPSVEAQEAIRLVARTEGVFLDPVYTGKAMAGLIELVRKRVLTKNDRVVFVHTGGWPALFA